MLSDTLRHFCRNIKEIKSVDGVPMEKNRIEVNIDDLKQKYNELDNHLKIFLVNLFSMLMKVDVVNGLMLKQLKFLFHQILQIHQ